MKGANLEDKDIREKLNDYFAPAFTMQGDKEMYPPELLLYNCCLQVIKMGHYQMEVTKEAMMEQMEDLNYDKL